MPHHHCCISGCRSDSRYSKSDDIPSASNEALRFFCVPSSTSKRALHNEWLKMIGRPELIISRNTRVCSLHFVDGKPSKENPLPTLRLLSHNVPTRRRARSSKSNFSKISATNISICKKVKLGKKVTKKLGFSIPVNYEEFQVSQEDSELHGICGSEINYNGSTEEGRALNCLKNGSNNENGALQIITSPILSSTNQSLLYSSLKSNTSTDFESSSHCFGQIRSLPQQLNYGTCTKSNGHYGSISLDEGSVDSSNSLIVAPETIIHEYKQTQTDEKLTSKVSSETQTEILTSMTRVPLILWEGANEKNYQFQCQQLRAKVSHLRQQIRKRPNNVFVSFGIELVKKDITMMEYYSGFKTYLEFRDFLEELKPKLCSENFTLDCFYTLENELLLVLAYKRINMETQDLAFRSGMTICRVEKIINVWSPILDQHSSKPWRN